MAVSKFGILCIAAVLAGGLTAGLADSEPSVRPAQDTAEHLATPIVAIANPMLSFRDAPVEFNSGREFGRVVAVAINNEGRATKVRVALRDLPSQQIWLDQADLVYSRSRGAIIAHDVHAPDLAVAAK
ncbi:MAG: hypothetical protein ISP45_04175 [Reyranella sp.]|nr:hypothetical protein [Reyranella sp.]